MNSPSKIRSYAPDHKVDDVLFDIAFHEITGDVPEHRHENCIEITVVINGSALHHSDGKDIRLLMGDICVTLPGGSHSMAQCDCLKLCTVSCCIDVQNVLGFNLNFLYGMHDLFGGEGKTNIFHLNSSDFFDVIRIIQKMNDGQLDQNHSELRCYFTILLCLLTQGYMKYLMAGKENLALNRVLDYINAHFREKITLSRLAKLAAMSESQLFRRFRENFNTTPIDYQLELRIIEARRMLENTNLSISEITGRAGFSDSNYFSHYFRKKNGLSPRQYRQQFRQNK